MPTAIVTGASRGLGAALAAGLARAGWTVIADGRTLAASPSPSESTPEPEPEPEPQPAASPPRMLAVPGDVTDPAHRAALVAAAGHRLDLLVNNAGILGPSPQPPLADYPPAVLREVFEVNVFAPLALTQLALPLLRAARGAVVNITSDAAVEAYPGWGGYGAAKAAVEQAGNVLAAEEPELRVWAADPGDLRTRMHQEAFPGEDISDRPLPESVVPGFLRLIWDRPPSGRVRLADLSGVPVG
jgi:NAD(P)-dependent dehydrogenase (short-subunit alcohol dehydrogenase family)